MIKIDKFNIFIELMSLLIHTVMGHNGTKDAAQKYQSSFSQNAVTVS